MISHELKCIFIHISRNGGKSIENAIWNVKAIHGSANHTKIKQWQHKLDKNIFDNYFKFTFSRNPWDRTVSLYHYYKQRNYYKDRRYFLTPKIMRSFETFVKFLESENGKLVAPTQISWIKDLKDEFIIDFIGRFENYENDWNKVCKQLSITKKLPHLNKSKHKDYKIYYNKKLIKMVEDIYKEDIDFFNYDF